MSDAGAALRRWRERPDIFVREVFGAVPDPWQDDVLRAFPTSPRIAMKACKGPGKSCVLAWLAWNFLLTRPHPKVAATSITGANLRDGLWTEMALWRGKSPLIQATFEWTKERIFSKDHPETWWMSARQWAKSADAQQQSNTLAGLHADYILFLLDESGGIPDSVMAAADAALSTGIEAHIIQAGNPTHLEGPLYRACTVERRLWHVVEITSDPDDPKRTPRVKAEWARDQIERYGRDNPFVLVNVFGRFPPASLNALIGPDEMAEASRRSYREEDIRHAAKVLGVDVARFGDDSSIIFPRQGLVAMPPLQYRGIDGIQGAGAVARKWQDWGGDACFIDGSGGWATSWVDALRQIGHAPISVSFSGEPHDRRYYNKRAEMYFECAAWIKNGGQVPPIPELVAAMTQTTYSFKGDRLLLEDKAQIKERLGYSPDHADALVLTFAQPVLPTSNRNTVGRHRHNVDYDPYAVRV